jgi:hypothetical protein
MMDTTVALLVHRTPRFLGLSILLILLFSSVLVASADVVVVAESNGFPGASAANDALLRIAMKKSAMRIINSTQYHVVTVDIENDRFVEFSAYYKAYEVKTVKSFDKYRVAREKTQAEAIKAYHTMKNPEEKKRALRELRNDGIELNGIIVAKTIRGKEVKEFKIRVGGVMKTVKCTRIMIRENNSLQPSFDMWVTKDLTVEEKFLRFYELGTFSKPVIAELKKVQEFPVRIEALVDTGAVKKRIHYQVKSIEHENVPDWGMTAPKSFKQVTNLNKYVKAQDSLQGAGKAEGPTLICKVCGKMIPVISKAESYDRKSANKKNKRYWFCNSVCRKQFIKSGKWKRK